MVPEFIEDFINSFNPMKFEKGMQRKDNGSYLGIENSHQIRLNHLKSNKPLLNQNNFLIHYLVKLKKTMVATVDIYSDFHKGFDMDIHLEKMKIFTDNIESFRNIDYIINITKTKGEYKLAYQLKEYCLLKLEESISLLFLEFGIKVYESPLANYFESIQKRINDTISLKKVELLSDTIENRKKDFKEFTWFKIGLLFAKGEPQKLYKKYKLEKGHFTKIAKELGFKTSDKVFFSETLNNSTESNNNIFFNRDKMQKIINHCKENQIDIEQSFLDKLPPE